MYIIYIYVCIGLRDCTTFFSACACRREHKNNNLHSFKNQFNIYLNHLSRTSHGTNKNVKKRTCILFPIVWNTHSQNSTGETYLIVIELMTCLVKN